MESKYHKFLHDPGVDIDPVFERKLIDLFRKISLYLNRRDLDFEVHVGDSGNPHRQVAWTSGFRMAIHVKSHIPATIPIFLDEDTPMEYYAFLIFHEYGHTQYAPENGIVPWAVLKLLEREGYSRFDRTMEIANLVTDIIINVSMLYLPDLDKIGLENKPLFKSKFKIEMGKDIETQDDRWDFYRWHKWYYMGKVGNAPKPDLAPYMDKLFANRKKPVYVWKDEFYELFKEIVKRWA